jgi:hypothetical protein
LVLLSPQSAAHSCTCRAHGRDYAQGQLACIRGVMAKCGMMLNNSSWIMTNRSCPVSARPVVLARLVPPGSKPKACFL